MDRFSHRKHAVAAAFFAGVLQAASAQTPTRPNPTLPQQANLPTAAVAAATPGTQPQVVQIQPSSSPQPHTVTFPPLDSDLQMVNLRDYAPTIVIELRYATNQNIAHRPLYSAGVQPMVRAGVARRLTNAQSILRQWGYGLKIWDAYRPPNAQVELWKVMPNKDFVANPEEGGGSLHSWGAAVDATLVDSWNRPVTMPTDFDDFTPAAMMRYTGADPHVRGHLAMLQSAMGRSSFYGMRTEWWHFTPTDWKRYVPQIQVKDNPTPRQSKTRASKNRDAKLRGVNVTVH